MSSPANDLWTIARKFLVDEQEVRAQMQGPFLVWDMVGGRKPTEEFALVTQSGARDRRSETGAPKVFELKKGTSKQNAFAMGVTVGRTDSNDVVLDDNSVSRFHAYFQQDARTSQWKVVDAESKNGTWLGTAKLLPNKGQPVLDTNRLRFGDLELTFMERETFFTYLRKQIQG